MRRKGWLGMAVVCLASSISLQAVATPETRQTFTPEEREILLGGGVVPRPVEFRRHGGRYVGGVSYQLINAPHTVVYASVASVRSLSELLPHTQEARRLEDAADGLVRVELTQGNRLVRATYTVCLELDPARGEVRFWLDSDRPHDIDDVWGYFRAQPFRDGRTLVTVATALDLGAGLGRMLFEDAVQTIALATPNHIRSYVEPRYLALR